MHHDKVGYKEAIDNSRIASPERRRVPVNYITVIAYFKERSHKAWYWGFLKPRDSVERIGPWSYALVVGVTEGPVLLDSTSKEIGLLEPKNTANVNILKSPLTTLQYLYSGEAYLKEPDQEALDDTRKMFRDKEREHEQ